jgi:polyhydroxybutyrate depolymerase
VTQTGSVRRLGILGLVAAVCLGLVAAAPVVRTDTPGCAPGLHTGLVTGRPYLVYVPATAQLPAPVIVTFHGRLQKAITQIRGTGLQEMADREGVVLIAPQARGGKWDFRGSDTTFTGQVLDNLTCDDPQRTYASGMSMGSAMSFLQACASPRRFAAIGGVAFEIYLPKCAQPDPVPIIAFHGTADQVVPFAGGLTASTATAPPAEATMRRWARHNRCQQYVRTIASPGVTLRVWNECAQRSEVRFYRIRGGKHVWPRGNVDAANVMWDFFDRYRLS